ncbi:MAG: DNA topoisomerase, partial [Rikenellaceae bacterium]
EFLTSGGQQLLKAELRERLKSREEVQAFLHSLISADFRVENVTTSPSKRTPAAPFTTSTLQQEASRKLGFSVSQTMSLAQRLYEAGHITYMRTDSVNLSTLALGMAHEAVVEMFGDSYYKYRTYSTKSKGAQEAHEAIRPTNFKVMEAGDNDQQRRLYQLIWRRTVATQMSDARLENTTIEIGASSDSRRFVSRGEVVIFDGFLKLYMESRDDEGSGGEKEGLLPSVSIGESLERGGIVATLRHTNRPARYSEASLVKQLEELGIGRPSTYAPTITTVISRGYVVKESRDGEKREAEIFTLSGAEILRSVKVETVGSEKNKLFPTDIGMVVTDFLEQNFTNVLDYGFTAGVEAQFDDIAQGKMKWQQMLSEFYSPFHQSVSAASENSDFVRSERELGVDPASGEMVIARVGRYGPMVQLGDVSQKRYAKIPANRLVENITLAEALELFRLPREVGEFEGEKMVVSLGRFGPFVRHKGAFTSLGKEDDPYTVSGERCVELIEAKREADIKKIIRVFEEQEISILNGRWGPYISFQKKNYKIAKGTDPLTLTVEDCQKLISEQSTADAATPKKRSTSTRAKAATTTKKTATTKKATAKTTAKNTATKTTTTKK